MKTPNSLQLYIHWPWCLAKCPYCDFNAHVWDDIPRAAYLDALRLHLRQTFEITGKRSLESVFFGGGTPSLMGAGMISDILAEVQTLWDIPATTEITVECNPTSSSESLFRDLAATGVNRVSVGVQSTQDDWLAFLGRKHASCEALLTLEMALKHVGNVNADIIFGLPNQSLDRWTEQLDSLARMGLSHISAYQLTIEPQTAFWGAVKRGEWAPLDNDTQATFLTATTDLLEERGYTRYEISNFAQPGRECRHNSCIWQYGDYAGVGAGAHGRLTTPDGTLLATRATKHPRHYLEHAQKGDNLLLTQKLSLADAWTEALLAGLRLTDGIDIPALEARLNHSSLVNFIQPEGLQLMHQMCFLEHTATRLRLTPRGRDMMDSVLGQLL